MSVVDFSNLAPPYGTLMADPPWRYNSATTILRSGGRGAGAEHHYPTMDNDEIAAMPVADLAADQAHLYMWVTNPRLIADRKGRRDVTPFDIVEAWGFRPITLLTWVKPGRGGTGWYFRGQTEHVIFGTRGKLGIPSQLREPNVFTAPRSRHSAKPDEAYALAERVSPGPRLDLFARNDRAGWDVWGNEVESTPFDELLAAILAAPSLEALDALRSSPGWAPEHEALAVLRARYLEEAAA